MTNNGRTILLKRKMTVRETLITIVIVVVFILVITLSGERDPVVDVRAGGIEIRAMYGTSVEFSDMTRLCLLDESMSEIGIGARTNGFAGFGGTLKGNFKSDNEDGMLIFVYKNSSPTIQIQRESGKDIYISLRDSEKTIMLYDEIESVFLGDNGVYAETAADDQAGSSKFRSRCAVRRDYLNQE
jgi:hypothetical protein